MNAAEVTVIDYGVGNLLSVRRGLEHCGAKVVLTADPEKILHAKRVVLPGVGAFANGMEALEKLGLVSVIRELAQRNVPLLGICLGMQLLLDESDEFGVTAGLGVIPGRVTAVPNLTMEGRAQKIPHIGWSALQPTKSVASWENTWIQDVLPGESVYFVHSFMALPNEISNRIADCDYGGHRVPAVIGRGHTVGCQFHPEKSGEVGLKILKRFCID